MILVTLVSSGLATATNTVRWCMTLLATRPDLQEAAFNAIRKVYPTDREAFEAVMKDDEEVPYISALVRESLRYVSLHTICQFRKTACRDSMRRTKPCLQGVFSGEGFSSSSQRAGIPVSREDRTTQCHGHS